MMTPDQISHARAAIVAKAAYWDALREFEGVTTGRSDEWSEYTNDKVCETIDYMAACAGTRGSADDACLTDTDIEAAFSFLCKDE